MRKSISILALFFVGLLGGQWAKADSCNGVSAANNLIQNCAFSSGDFTSWSGSATSLTSPDFVTQFDGFASSNGANPNPYVGLYEADLGDFDSTGTLSQTFATIAGETYTVEFALQNDTSAGVGYNNSFVVDFGLEQLGLPLINAAAGTGWTVETYSGTATGSSTTLTFTDENDAGFWDLDSVSVAATPAATPEPSSFLLLGSGILALAGAARRRFVR
jgi:hypothetical protein